MENEPKQEKIEKKINRHEFYFETPLYEFISSSDIEDDLHNGDIDAYSAKNSIDTTYSIYSRSVDGQYESSFPNFYKITLTCKRKKDDILRFFVYDNDEIVVKLGQLPSLADIQFAKIGKKYDTVLDKESLFEFKRAIGLAAHGTGVGSFVYLRRIFENLIFETYKEYKTTLGVDEKDFVSKKMEDKVEVLKSHLPSQLVEMKSVYSILSKGLHELSEEECLAYFEPLKLSIELILDQKIEMDLKKQRDKRVKDEIQNIHKKLGK